jgi:S-adenosylmethionine decarboxylase
MEFDEPGSDGTTSTQMEKFEGPEKKLEIRFSFPQTGMRGNADGRWTRVVRACGAEIIKVSQTHCVDSYLLSESSLFVWDDRLLLITCGQTNPIFALPEILNFVNRDQIAAVVYERKKANFPQYQKTNFGQDRAFLDRYFSGCSTRLGQPSHDYLDVYYYSAPDSTGVADATLQMLMHDIYPATGDAFIYSNRGNDRQLKTLLSLYAICNGSSLDSHFFYPQGYSLNGISGRDYVTLHVTPQKEASFVSFGTNAVNIVYDEVIRKLASLFRPACFSVVITAGLNGAGSVAGPPFSSPGTAYRLTCRGSHQFDHNYRSLFFHYQEET